MRLRALLDANVLYPATLRSLLIDLAVADLYGAFWMDEIHDEWIRNLASHRPELDRVKLERTRALMDRALETALLTDVPPLGAAITLPDEDDRHVLAAALHVGADVIVTQNLRDFPAQVLEPLGLQAVAPEDFLLDLLGADPRRFAGAVRAGRSRLRTPPFTAQEYLDALARQGLPQLADALRPVVQDCWSRFERAPVTSPDVAFSDPAPGSQLLANFPQPLTV